MKEEIFDSSRNHYPSTDAEIQTAWFAFQKAYPTEESCLKAIVGLSTESIEVSSKSVFICSYCGGNNLCRSDGDRKASCIDCNKKSWLTAGSFFHGIRKAQAWLAAIWFLEQGITISSLSFHKIVGVSQSCAWQIFRKLSMVMDGQTGSGFTSIAAQEFASAIGKRSIETPARLSPLSEFEIRADSSVVSNSSQNIDTTYLSASQKLVYEAIGEDGAYVDHICDGLGISIGQVLTELTILELNQLVEVRAGNFYARTIVPNLNTGTTEVNFLNLPAATKNFVKSVIAYSKLVFKGISKKYLQLYVSMLSAKADASQWLSGKLLRLCQQSGKITDIDLKAYTTPTSVKLKLLG